MVGLGRLLIVLGLVIVFTGVVILVAARFFPWLGKLPGDFRFEAGDYIVYFPLATMILISVLGTILLNIVLRILRR